MSCHFRTKHSGQQMEQVDTGILATLGDSYTDPGQCPNRRQLGIYLIPAGVATDPELIIASSFFAAGDFHCILSSITFFQIPVAGISGFHGLRKPLHNALYQTHRFASRHFCFVLSAFRRGWLGYGIGAVLVPAVLRSTQLDAGITISTSPVIFLGSMLFALLTGALSCSKPGKMAPRVSPVGGYQIYGCNADQEKQRQQRPGEPSSIRWPYNWDETRKTVLVVLFWH